MPTLIEMCQEIAKHTLATTAEELLEYSNGGNSMESSLRLGEISAMYSRVLSLGVKQERIHLNFMPNRGEPFVVEE